MGLFGKKKSRDDIIAEGIAEQEAEAATAGQKKDDEFKSGNPKVDIEFTKIKAQLEALAEVRKTFSERFSRTSEQLGELRGMIVDANKAMSKIEVAATKATDLVESVHPEKLMIEVRKQDGKLEALRASIESNEAIMKDLMAEVKRMRDQMNFYKGTEQVIQLNDEVKQELANIKKMEALIEKHADRVETIFIEVEKKFNSFEKYDSTVKEVQEGFRKVSNEFEKLRAKVATKEDKKEFVDLLDKFNDFEKHTTNLLKLLDDRSKLTKSELETNFKKMRQELIKDIKSGKVEQMADKEIVQDQKDAEKKAAEEEAQKRAEEANKAEEKRLKDEEQKLKQQEEERKAKDKVYAEEEEQEAANKESGQPGAAGQPPEQQEARPEAEQPSSGEQPAEPPQETGPDQEQSQPDATEQATPAEAADTQNAAAEPENGGPEPVRLESPTDEKQPKQSEERPKSRWLSRFSRE